MVPNIIDHLLAVHKYMPVVVLNDLFGSSQNMQPTSGILSNCDIIKDCFQLVFQGVASITAASSLLVGSLYQLIFLA